MKLVSADPATRTLRLSVRALENQCAGVLSVDSVRVTLKCSALESRRSSLDF
jgi:hypothetical protein